MSPCIMEAGSALYSPLELEPWNVSAATDFEDQIAESIVELCRQSSQHVWNLQDLGKLVLNVLVEQTQPEDLARSSGMLEVAKDLLACALDVARQILPRQRRSF